MLTLWKRHRDSCLAELKNDPKIPPEERRFFKRCSCPCWATGTHPITDKYIKQSLETTSWEEAEKKLEILQGKTPAALVADTLTVEDAFEKWFATKRFIGTGESTIDTMYAALQKKVLVYCTDHGIVKFKQFTSEDVRDMVEHAWRVPKTHGRNGWSASTQKRQYANLKSFFKYAVSRDWCDKDPMRAMVGPRARHTIADPYTPDELERIDLALQSWPTGRTNDGQWALRPATFRCLIRVMKETGLRISDAQRVNPGMITRLASGTGQCTLEQKKLDGVWGGDDGEVTVYLTPQTLEEIERVPWVSRKYPFLAECAYESNPDRFARHLRGEAKKTNMVLTRIGKLAGVEDVRPHRFRHTFAATKLMAGWPPHEVARLMGHKNLRTFEKFYAKWTPSRQDQIRERIEHDWETARVVTPVRRQRGPVAL